MTSGLHQDSGNTIRRCGGHAPGVEYEITQTVPSSRPRARGHKTQDCIRTAKSLFKVVTCGSVFLLLAACSEWNLASTATFLGPQRTQRRLLLCCNATPSRASSSYFVPVPCRVFFYAPTFPSASVASLPAQVLRFAKHHGPPRSLLQHSRDSLRSALQPVRILGLLDVTGASCPFRCLVFGPQCNKHACIHIIHR